MFQFFQQVDECYSPFIENSDVSRINQGDLHEKEYSRELQEILALAQKTGSETKGYFDVWHNGTFDPSGIVKGWAIQKASDIFRKSTKDFYIEAGGDIQVSGRNDTQKPWRVGIRNPFNRNENVSVVELSNCAVATSGSAIRGQHIYDPVSSASLTDVVSMTVLAPRIIDADRMATAAFAMGKNGILFIEGLPGYEGYMIDSNRQATMTTGWYNFEVKAV